MKDVSRAKSRYIDLVFKILCRLLIIWPGSVKIIENESSGHCSAAMGIPHLQSPPNNPLYDMLKMICYCGKFDDWALINFGPSYNRLCRLIICHGITRNHRRFPCILQTDDYHVWYVGWWDIFKTLYASTLTHCSKHCLVCSQHIFWNSLTLISSRSRHGSPLDSHPSWSSSMLGSSLDARHTVVDSNREQWWR